MRGFRLCLERDKAHLVGLPYLLKRPANARIARQAQAAVGRSLKRGDDDRLGLLVSDQSHRQRDWAPAENSSLAAQESTADAKRRQHNTAVFANSRSRRAVPEPLPGITKTGQVSMKLSPRVRQPA
jgi:hypothetical protein